MKNSTALNRGLKPIAYLLAIVSVFLITSAIENNNWEPLNVLVLGTCITVSVLFYFKRKLVFDDDKLCIMRGHWSTFICFEDMVSIKRSRIKINGTHLWKICYYDNKKKEKVLRYKEGVFCFGSTKKLIESVKKRNSKLTVWTHPHFNH